MLAQNASIALAAHLGEQECADARVLVCQDREVRRHALAGAGDADLGFNPARPEKLQRTYVRFTLS
jgi:hypothetical protein